MPGINLTPYINPRGELGAIPQNTLERIRSEGAGRSAQVQLGGSVVTIRTVFLGHFLGSISPAGLSGEGLRSALSNISALERQLNSSGMSHREILDSMPSTVPPRPSVAVSRYPAAHPQPLLNRIDACSFSVGSANLTLPQERLICPITLCVPDNGVFVRTSLQSEVCCLYDSTALKELVSRRLPHPISREAITGAHIIPKEQCHFDQERGAFIHSASELR
ncbi:TPA: T3SS effector NleG family protein [Salmonella enterica]|nr:T3SS effector NleG family protein [Salmonella enterica]